MSNCSDSQGALKALEDVRTTAVLVRQCQKALNDISARHAVGLFWVPGRAGVRRNEIADELARSGSVLKFIGPEPALGVSRQDTRRRIRCWLDNQHLVCWRVLGDTQRQARELISGPCLIVKARLLFFNRIQSRAVTDLLTRHNTLRRHFHLMGLSALFVEGVEQRMRPLPTFFVSVKLWLRSDMRICAHFFLEPEDIKSIILGAIWNFSKATGLP